jgi:urease accessory protein
MRTLLHLLADGRLPTGGHAHSGGLEAAVSNGLVTGAIDDLERFLRGRLNTVGATAAGLAAAACAGSRADASQETWEELDAEADARSPCPAARAASRAQGRGLVRLARAAWPHPLYHRLGPAPHLPVGLGAVAGVAGAAPEEAATLAAWGSISGAAWAAVRLQSLDPIEVTALVARLSSDADQVAAAAAGRAAAGDLPAWSAPLLDLLAATHAEAEVRLFAS